MPTAKYLQMAADIARHHHERFNGSGYPDGLSGTAIPLAARILSVADVFDALTSKRVYKNAVSVSEAAKELCAGAGTQFDPAVVNAFEARLDVIRMTQARFAAHCAMYDSALTPQRVHLDTASRQTWFLEEFGQRPGEMRREQILSAP
jgi:hypothetical protein